MLILAQCLIHAIRSKCMISSRWYGNKCGSRFGRPGSSNLKLKPRRFSICAVCGVNKYRAQAGADTIPIHFYWSLFEEKYCWTWTDGSPISIEMPTETSGKPPIITMEDTELLVKNRSGCFVEPATGWAWDVGDRRLSHRAAYRRRFKTWRAWWCARPRHVLQFDSGTVVAAWYGEGNHRRSVDGVIRRSAGDGLARIAFGIVLCVYLSSKTRGSSAWTVSSSARRVSYAMLLKTLGQLLALVVAFCIVWLVCFGWEIDKASVMGHTAADVRSQYGEPDATVDFRKGGGDGYRWDYRRGLLGFDRIKFDNNDLVIAVDRGAGTFP